MKVKSVSRRKMRKAMKKKRKQDNKNPRCYHFYGTILGDTLEEWKAEASKTDLSNLLTDPLYFDEQTKTIFLSFEKSLQLSRVQKLFGSILSNLHEASRFRNSQSKIKVLSGLAMEDLLIGDICCPK